MARNLFGGTSADVAEDVSGARVPNATGTVWDGVSEGASRITDLLSEANSPISELTSDSQGMVASFYGPDNGAERLYVDFGAGRVALVATNAGERLKAHTEALDPHGDRQAIEQTIGVPNGIAGLGPDGKVFPSQLPDVASTTNSYFTGDAVQLGAASADTGGAKGTALGIANVSTPPSENPSNGVVAYSEGGRLKVRQTDGKTIIVGDESLVGEAGRKYRILSTVIRNTGAGWEFINDIGHRPTGFTAITTMSNRIELAHPVGGTRVSSFQITPDETFAAQGVRCGASVGQDLSNIYLYTEPADRISDRIYWDTASASWKSEKGVFSGFSFSGGILTITHENMGTTGQVSVSQRGAVGAFVGNSTATTSQIVFYTGAFGSLTAATTPVAAMNCYVTRFGIRAAPVANPNSVVSAAGNFWITALIEL